MSWDIFISHASEDKEEIVRPLAQELRSKGLKVWYDDFTLTVGESLRRKIECGLATSRFGIVVLSPNFFAKEWTQRELDGLTTREISGEKVILPIWHNVSREEVTRYSPVLADRLSVSTSCGLDYVVTELLRAMSRMTELEAGEVIEKPIKETRFVTDRYTLIQELNALPIVHFNTLISVLNPPPGQTPPPEAAQTSRVAALLNWAEGTGGCGFDCIRQTFDRMLSRT